MNEERYRYLQNVVYGSKEAKELFEYERDLLLSQPHVPSVQDPHNEGAKIGMAVAEMYQYFININKQLTEGKEDGISTTGQPTAE